MSTNKKEWMTIGELAAKTGVTPKALRIYEAKGMIQSVRGEENNYRFYDKSCLVRLQQIRLLKYLGFSLDSIHDFINHFDSIQLTDTFLEQKALLIKKKKKLDSMIACMERAAQESRDQKLDIQALGDALNRIILNRKADEGVMYISLYSNEPEGWSRFIWDQVGIHRNMKVLDAGSGWGNLWRYNSERIPEELSVTCLDQHNTHADQFAEYVEQGNLPGCNFHFVWADMESYELKEKYSRIFFNHVVWFIKNRPALYKKLRNALSPGGFVVATWGGTALYDVVEMLLAEYRPKLAATFEKGKMECIKDTLLLEEELRQSFPNVEKKQYPLTLRFESLNHYAECIEKVAVRIYPEIKNQHIAFCDFLQSKQNDKGEFLVNRNTFLFQCGEKK